jgi:hypothetical protein
VVLLTGDTLYAAVAGPPDQLYVLAPLAVSVVLLPEQIIVLPLMLITGKGLTVTDIVCTLLQPTALVPVTVYTIFDCGDASTAFEFARFSPVAGAHEYVLAPDAVNVVLSPKQIVLPPETVTVGLGFMVTVAVAVPKQLDEEVTVHEYVPALIPVINALVLPDGDQ